MTKCNRDVSYIRTKVFLRQFNVCIRNRLHAYGTSARNRKLGKLIRFRSERRLINKYKRSRLSDREITADL